MSDWISCSDRAPKESGKYLVTRWYIYEVETFNQERINQAE